MFEIGKEIKLMVWGENITYRSRIADFNENEFMVELPWNAETGKNGLFPRGTFFDVIVLGKDRAVYKFASQLKAKLADNIPLIVLEKPFSSAVERIQRREFVRVPDALKIVLKTEECLIPAETTDISAGGLSVKVNGGVPIEDGMSIDCELFLPNPISEILSIRSKVIRMSKQVDSSKISLKYVDLDKSVRQKLTKYVYSIQVEMRRKGIL